MRNSLFNMIKVTRPKTNVFDLSHERKMSFNMGELVPFFLEEIVPGDKIRMNSEIFIRLAPMLAPLMHRVNVYTHYFFVPNRLLWDNWETFITGGVDGLQAPAFPYVEYTTGDRALFYKGTLADYLGCPPAADAAVTSNARISALPFRAYQLIYNEYYRDQTLHTAIALTKGDTVDAAEKAAIMALRNRCWEKDYFTSALNDTQRGAEVLLPGTPDYRTGGDHIVKAADGTAPADGTIDVVGGHLQMASGADNDVLINDENLESYDISINDLRQASRLQEWLEKNMRGGSRYIEQIFHHFGVKSPDERLQRPEYLGGGKQPVVISEVLNTSSTATEPQGTMTGHGISTGGSNSFKKFFSEHGYVLGIMSVLPRTAYQQGIPRYLNKVTDKYEYYWPEFANLGEQAVASQELYYDQADNAGNIGVFGYQSRYAEYKFKNSSVHGDFHDSFDYWHMGRQFAARPSLNGTFVSADPTHRIFAVTTETVDKLYCQIYNNIQAIRPMPKFGTPHL